jgi:hypothetical protein
MLSPFKLTWRLLIAGFRIAGYIGTFIVQVILYLRLGGPQYKLGDAAGQLGKGVTDALADVFRE